MLPQQGPERPWRLYQNYLLDYRILRFGKLEDGVLEFSAPDREAKATATSEQELAGVA